MLRSILLLAFVLGVCQNATADVVRIADGDCSGFAGAVTSASSRAGSTTILLARNGSYPSCSLNFAPSPDEPSTLLIDGQGADLQFSRFYVAAGSMTLRNVSFDSPPTSSLAGIPCVAILLSFDTVYYQYATLICNSGALTLDTVSFHDVVLHNFTSPVVSTIVTDSAALIGNTGNLLLRNVTAANISSSTAPSQVVGNAGGSLEIYNSSFVNTQFASSAGSAGSIVNLEHPDDGSRARIVNSLFSGNSVAACDQPVKSVGGNFASDASCGFAIATGDTIGQGAGLATFGSNGGLVPTQALTYSSPARGIGIAQYCEALDARGYTRAATTCDAGAYEYGGGAGALTASGSNGVFYDAAADGHYVSIQRIHDNGDILVIWNTFDQSGNPAWIYGVGQLTDKHIHVAMAQNLGGVLQPGGPALGSKSRPWGTVDIDLTTCLLAQFNYQSSLSEFGSGAFPLTRLAIVADFGCSN